MTDGELIARLRDAEHRSVGFGCYGPAGACMSLSPNMTEDKLKALLDALPDEMDEGELCATTLTIYRAFMDDPAQIISELIATIYTLGQTSGMSRKDISFVLRASSDAYDAVHRTQTKH